MYKLSIREAYSSESVKSIFKRGGVIIYPTDTVYGLGGDPFNINTVSRIIHLKRRRGQPFPILVSSPERAFRIIRCDGVVTDLIKSFWPGALTIVGESRFRFPGIFFMDKVGVRMPGHDDLLKLIEWVGGYIIGTSANISGYPPAKSIDDAYRYFHDGVDLYIEGGGIGGKPSTVVEIDPREGRARITRRGPIDISRLRNFFLYRGYEINEEF